MFNIGGYPLIKLSEFFTDKTVGNGKIRFALGEGKDLLEHPVFMFIFVLTFIVLIWGWRNRGKVDYA